MSDVLATAEREAIERLRVAPADADAGLRLAMARRRRGDLAGARDVLTRLVGSRQASPLAWEELGGTLAAMGDETGAMDALRRAVALQPGLGSAWRALGDLQLLNGDDAAADRMYAEWARASVQGTKLAPAAEALCAGRAAQAEAMLKPLVQENQADPAALNLLALAAIRLERVAAAEAVLLHGLSVAPDFADARHNLAVLLYCEERYVQAVPHFAWLLQWVPHESCLRKFLAACLSRAGDEANAIPMYEALLAAHRPQPKIWLLYGHALKTVGREDEAANAYRMCIGLDAAPAGYLSLAEMKTAAFTDAEIAAMRAAASRAGLPAAEQAQLHYALGRGLEQRAAYADAFAQYAEGARLRRSLLDYDADRTSAAFARTRALLDADFFAARRGGGCPSDAPIFVLGLARSGSTLVEQILASHPAVEGTHEMVEISVIAGELGFGAGAEFTRYPGTLADLDAAARRHLGERFLAKAAQFRRTARPFFTDKMPDNFRHIGLIQLILPNARIVDVRRGPMAAGLALFKQHFQSGQHFTYDLTEIGRFYRDYVALMTHFDAVLPGRIHHLRYEDLVTDTEAQVRALLAYCGLPFDAACLRFWETRRPVQTPSAQQVRRPIFREGLDDWRHYEPWLGPLRDALGALAHD